MTNLPRYQCHKQVNAAKIAMITHSAPTVTETSTARIDFVEPDVESVEVDASFLNKHKPQIGGYLVAYDDGYLSFSPAAAFESGYSRI